MVEGARGINGGTTERWTKQSTYGSQINEQKNYISYRHYFKLNKLFN